MEYANYTFGTCFLLEAILKISAFSFEKYLLDGWNKFDFVMVIIRLASTIDAVADTNVGTRTARTAQRGPNYARALRRRQKALRAAPCQGHLVAGL